MALDPFTNDLLLFGGETINQIDPTHPTVVRSSKPSPLSGNGDHAGRESRRWPRPRRALQLQAHIAHWIQERGGWTTAKVLLDVYGHFMPTDMRGFADAIAAPMVE